MLAFFLAIAAIFATGACTGRHDVQVGVRSIDVAPAGRAGFRARVWYPTSGGAPETIDGNAVRVGYRAVPDGSLALRSSAPLVVLCHGSGGGAESMAWIAVDLAARGAIVIAADHPASSYGDPGRRSILDVWEQPADVSALLDQLLQSDVS